MKHLKLLFIFLLLAIGTFQANATVNVTTHEIAYLCDGSTTSYTFPFLVFEDDDVVVTKNNGGANTTLVLNTDYTVTRTVSSGASAGSITLDSGSECGSGYTLTMTRNVDATQSTDYQNGTLLNQDSIESNLDRAMILHQQQQEELERAIKFPVGTTSSAELSDATTRANTRIGFDNDGDLTLTTSNTTDYTGEIVETLASLQAVDTSALLNKTPAIMQFRATAGDGGGGMFYLDTADLSATLVVSTATSTAVDSGTETVTAASHGFSTGDAVVSGTAVNGLSANTIYYVIKSDANNYKLSDSYANAAAGTARDLTGTTNFTASKLLDPLQVFYVVSSGDDLTGTDGAWVRSSTGGIVEFRLFVPSGDGVTDDTEEWHAFFTYSNNVGGKIFLNDGTYSLGSTGASVFTKDVEIIGESKHGTILDFTDGAYAAFQFSSSAKWSIKNLTIQGTDNATPTITLVKARDTASYFLVDNVSFSAADIAIDIDNVYIGKITKSDFSKVDTLLKMDDAEGSTANILFENNTIGTCDIGTDPVIDVASPGLSIIANGIETQDNTKLLVNAATGTQRIIINDNNIDASGGIKIGTSVVAVSEGNSLFDAFYTSSAYSYRIDGGGVGLLNSNNIGYTTGGVNVGISASGDLTATGNRIQKSIVGVSGGSGIVDSNYFTGCTTGISTTTSELVIGNNFYSGNTTDVSRTLTELTIATGVITVANGDAYRVDTQSDDASDDLDTINGGYEGKTVILRAENDARDVVVKNGTGNILLDGGVDFTMDNSRDIIVLRYNSTVNRWLEVSRSNNGA